MSKDTAEETVVVSGWKEIANYLGRGVRTVQRYERELGLPVRRPAGKPAGSVIALKAELDAWVAASPARKPVRLPASYRQAAGILKDFTQSVADMRRLQRETIELGQAIRTSLQRFGTNSAEQKPVSFWPPTLTASESPASEAFPDGTVVRPKERKSKVG